MPAQTKTNFKSQLKIAYLCDFSPLDRNFYSGGNARIYDALQKHVGNVHILDTRWHAAEPLRKLVLALPEKLTLRLRWRLHLLLAPLIVRGVRREIAAGNFDVVFCAYSMQSIYRLKSPVPVVFTSDATPMTYKHSRIGQSFGSFLSISRLFDPLIQRAEKSALGDCDLLLWPTEWIKSCADSPYNLAPDRSIVVPWGANIQTPPREVNPPTLLPDAPVRLLFVGRDWFAKGGPTTHQTLLHLRAKGVDARLTVIGCVPPQDTVTEGVTVHAELNKEIPEDLALFQNAFQSAHFMVMASMESFGFAFCEASAYGLPSLCLRVGGVPIRDGINGHAIAPENDDTRFSKIIQGYINNPDDYQTLRQTTREEFETRLNWDAWGQTTHKKLRAL